MFRLTESRTMRHPASVVWPYLIAFEQVPLWEHGILEVRQLAPGPPVVGMGISARRVYGGKATQLHGSITEVEDGRSATMRLQGGPLAEVHATYAVEPVDAGSSRVTYSAVGSLVRPLNLLNPILPALGRAETRKNLASLERRIDAGIAPGSAQPTPPAA